MQEELEPSRHSHDKVYQRLYRKASREKNCCGKAPFHPRFDEMVHDISNRPFCSVMCSFTCYVLSQPNVRDPKDLQLLETQLPILKPNFDNQDGKIRYTWIGHSTAVIGVDSDINLMIDPVFS